MKNFKNYKTLEKNLRINTRDIELHIEVEVDGKIITKRKSDSLVGNFLKPIFAMMGGRLTMPETSLVDYDAIAGNGGSATITNIDSTGSDVVVTASGGPGGAGGFLQVSGIATSSGTALAGIWEYARSGTNYTLLGSGQGGVYVNNGGFVLGVSPDNTDIVPGNRIMQEPAIVLSTSDGPIAIDSYFVEEQIRMSGDGGAGSLDAGEITVSAPFADDTSSIFTVSRTFTNLSDAAIPIRKAGLFTNLPGGGSQSGLLIAEDFVSADLQPTETISINYKIRNATTSEGGILEQFNDILYTLMSGNNQNTRDVFGTNQTSWPGTIGGSLPFIAGGLPAADNQFPFFKFADNWRVGPVLGGANRSVKSTDYTLLDSGGEDSVITHGEGAGQLYFYGAVVENWKEDPVAGTAEFTISRLFENRSDGDVTVRQIGLNSAVFSRLTNSEGGFSGLARDIFCLSSNTLLAEEVFAPGAVGRVNIVLSVEV